MKLENIRRLLEPLSNRIGSLIAVGVLRRIDPGKDQQCQIEMLEDELRDRVPHHMPYGFTHVPMDGAEPLAVFLRGDKSGGIVIQIRDNRYQPTLKRGEVALHDDQSQMIHIARHGIHISTDKPVSISASEVTVDAPLCRFTGNVEIGKECTINGIAFTPHIHDKVIPGGGISGKPVK